MVGSFIPIASQNRDTLSFKLFVRHLPLFVKDFL